MLNPIYDIEVTDDRTQFGFISESVNGKFTKVVLIAETVCTEWEFRVTII